jgi:hypothetical protein
VSYGFLTHFHGRKQNLKGVKDGQEDKGWGKMENRQDGGKEPWIGRENRSVSVAPTPSSEV